MKFAPALAGTPPEVFRGGFFVRKGYKQMPDQREVLDEWRQDVLKDWSDSRLVSSLWLDVHIWWDLHLYADLAEHAIVLDGWTVREEPHGTLLVLKVTREDIPYVVFMSSKDTTGCMRRVREELRNGGLKLFPDKYR